MTSIDTIDLRLIEATQAGLPIVEAPYRQIAEEVGISETDVIERLTKLMGRGVIRRIGAAPNHYALGMVANGMTVWDVDDDDVSAKGSEVGALEFVTHCYLRPRALPDWPFNLFAMVHGATRDEVAGKRARIAELLGSTVRSSDILYSKRILKKTGLRISRKGV
jgi:siroheme decarboxylase